jgi:hypothetical protein
MCRIYIHVAYVLMLIRKNNLRTEKLLRIFPDSNINLVKINNLKNGKKAVLIKTVKIDKKGESMTIMN